MLREALGKAADQALRAGHIIRRLREFVARGESDRRVENLAKLIEDASTLALIGARENGITVSFRLDPKADLVLADRIQIQQVLVNLIRNAIESMTETANDRQLEIASVAGSGELVEVSVTRHRPGPRARRRPPPVPALRHHQTQGHGPGPLDLPDDRRGARRQDLGRRPAEAAARSSGSHCAPPRLRRPSMAADGVVHVIDDDADVRQSLAFLLSTAGLAVRVHDSAVAFLKVLPEIKDGCVVTDVRMPGMDGLELQRRLRRARGPPCR